MTVKNSRLQSFVGIAGWSIPSQHRSAFGEADSVLARYATRFHAVEINSSFYRSHQRKTYERWAKTVPTTFRFAVKMPRHVTHELKLRRAKPHIARFAEECMGLGAKLGVILVQLPASLSFERRVATRFFELARAAFPDRIHLVCEPRHASWLSNSATTVLRAHNVNRVGADPSPVGASDSAQFGSCRYWRLHGSPHIYYSSYPDDALRLFANRVHDADDKIPSWIIFDNTAYGHAIADAFRFKFLLQKRPGRTQS